MSFVIVAVLAALLLSVHGKLNASHERMACTSNLRSIGVAASLFLGERKGELFPDKFWYGHKEGILNYLDERLSNSPQIDTIYTCKAFKKMRPTLFPSSLNRTYVLNYYALKYDPDSQYGDRPASERPLAVPPHRLSQIVAPAAMWMVADCAPNVGTVLRDRAATLETLITPHTPHTNVLFFDGHVRGITKDEFQNAATPFWKGMP